MHIPSNSTRNPARSLQRAIDHNNIPVSPGNCLKNTLEQKIKEFVTSSQHAIDHNDTLALKLCIEKLPYKDTRLQLQLIKYLNTKTNPDTCKSKIWPIVRSIIEEENLSLRNNTLNVMVIYATKQNNLEAIKILLTAGADPHVRDNKGNTLLHFAAVNGNKDMVYALLGAGTPLGIQNNHGIRAEYMSKNYDEFSRLCENYFHRSAMQCMYQQLRKQSSQHR